MLKKEAKNNCLLLDFHYLFITKINFLEEQCSVLIIIKLYPGRFTTPSRPFRNINDYERSLILKVNVIVICQLSISIDILRSKKKKKLH